MPSLERTNKLSALVCLIPVARVGGRHESLVCGHTGLQTTPGLCAVALDLTGIFSPPLSQAKWEKGPVKRTEKEIWAIVPFSVCHPVMVRDDQFWQPNKKKTPAGYLKNDAQKSRESSVEMSKVLWMKWEIIHRHSDRMWSGRSTAGAFPVNFLHSNNIFRQILHNTYNPVFHYFPPNYFFVHIPVCLHKTLFTGAQLVSINSLSMMEWKMTATFISVMQCAISFNSDFKPSKRHCYQIHLHLCALSSNCSDWGKNGSTK